MMMVCGRYLLIILRIDLIWSPATEVLKIPIAMGSCFTLGCKTVDWVCEWRGIREALQTVYSRFYRGSRGEGVQNSSDSCSRREGGDDCSGDRSSLESWGGQMRPHLLLREWVIIALVFGMIGTLIAIPLFFE
jgi:hypothetical protein